MRAVSVPEDLYFTAAPTGSACPSAILRPRHMYAIAVVRPQFMINNVTKPAFAYNAGLPQYWRGPYMFFSIRLVRKLQIFALAVLCACGQFSCKKTCDMRHENVSECPIHHVPLKEAVIALDKLSFFTDEYLEANIEFFRYSNQKGYISRWDSMPIEDYARVQYCQLCRDAEDQWLKSNPEHKPAIVDNSQIEDFRKQGDQRKWKCSLHDEPLGSRLTTIQYGVHLSPVYVNAKHQLFPNSFWDVTVDGTRNSDSPQFAAVGFCGKCRDAEEQWCTQHPNECKHHKATAWKH